MNTWILVAIAVLAIGGIIAQFFKTGESNANQHQGGCGNCQAPCALAGTRQRKPHTSDCHSAQPKV